MLINYCLFSVYATAEQTLCTVMFSIAHCNYSKGVFWSGISSDTVQFSLLF